MDGAKINILRDEVVGKISAGEVVERPASVVKELIENSIDAGADSIEIEIQAAGQALIRVADNGEGMTAEDAKMACRRHATSKIRDIDDLDRITTLGFRGEALSSIAAVSQMDLTSRTQSSEAGVYLYLESGEILKMRPAGRSCGTTVEVRNLFYNVPARRKFLKKEATELAEIVNVVGRFIVACPDIEFKLTQEERCLLHAARNMEMAERLRLVLGGDVADHMVEVSGSSDRYRVTGFVSRPSNTRKDRRSQMFFVNGRYFRSRVLSDTVHDAYRSLLERGRHPAVVLFLTVSPSELDVNVHPTKLQVKFSDERGVRKAVIEAIKHRFEELKYTDSESRPGLMTPPVKEDGASVSPPSLSAPSEVQTEFVYGPRGTAERSSSVPHRADSGLPGGSRGKEGQTEDQVPGMSSIPKRREQLTDHGMSSGGGVFQIGGCYIVRISPAGITITDQHAAHERILYEFFSRASERGSAEVQNLLFPVRIDLSASESVIMEKVIENFRALGFQIEPFGEKSFIVQAVPPILSNHDIKTVIYDVLANLSSYDLARIDLEDELVKLTSCHAAIRSGDVLSDEEMISLLDQLGKCTLPFTCPHGRPTMSEITIDELEKRFRRK